MARIQLDIRVDHTCETVTVESLDQWLYPLAETPYDTDREDDVEDDAEAEASHVVFNLQTDEPVPVPVVPRVSGMYRLLNSPVFTNREDDPMSAGDVIETELLSDGTHRVVRIAERSPMRTFTWVLSLFFLQSKEFAQFRADVLAAGGWLEAAFGGILWVHLTPESPFDPEAELSRRIAAARRVEYRQLEFMQSRIPAQDALEAFIPEGGKPDDDMSKIIRRTGFLRWY